MKRLIPALLVAAVIVVTGASFSYASEESECVKCHTNVKGLIRLGWEVEKVRPRKKSAETSGDG